MSAKTHATQAVTYELEVTIAAPRDVVWRSLVDQTQAWWLPDFHMVGPDSNVSFDARAGGQLVETTAAGGGLLWYTVAMVTPGHSLHLVGHVFPQWGGPGTSLLELSLEERAGATVLKVSDALVGGVDEAGANSLREGWTQLFSEGLKPYAEAAN